MQQVHDTLGERYGFSRSLKPNATQFALAVNKLANVRFQLLHRITMARLANTKRKQRGGAGPITIAFSPEEALRLLSDTR